jgi:hypothetical protein
MRTKKRAAAAQRGVCRFCGCTETTPCVDGLGECCAWAVQRAHDLTILGYGHPDFKGEYVGLPNGNVIKYDPETGKQYTFAPGQP